MYVLTVCVYTDRVCTVYTDRVYTDHVCIVFPPGSSLHQVDKEGLTALCWGCLKGHLHIIQSLLDRGSNLHHIDRCNRTPLQLAAFHGDAQVVSRGRGDTCKEGGHGVEKGGGGR
jgi:hypothetical protein